MTTIHDPAIPEIILKIADHYNNNIATRFMRPLLVGILADHELSRQLSEITDHSESYTAQGIHLDELYAQIQALARFVYLVRTEILPNIRVLSGSTSMKDTNKVYRDMAVNNFGANVTILADYVNELYLKTVAYDRAHSGGEKPVYRGIPGLSEIGRYLVGK